MEINAKLKLLRKQKGISQDEAAQSLGVSLSSYQKYEREKNSVTPSLEALMKLADFYDVTTDYLLGREPAQEPALNYAEVKEKTNVLIDRIEKLPPEYQDIMIKVLHMLHEADNNMPPPELRQSTMKYVGTVGEELERRQKAEEEAQSKETA